MHIEPTAIAAIQRPDPFSPVPRCATPTVLVPATYDALVGCSPQGSIYAHRWWLEALAPGAVEILEVRHGGALLAAWPIVRMNGGNGDGRDLGMPPLTQKLGILYAPSTGKPVEQQSRHQRLAAELIEKLGPFSRLHQNFHENFTDWLPFHWRGFTQTTRYTYVLENIADPAALWVAMRPQHRKAIRKAEKSRIRVRDDLPLDQFLELNRKTFARQHLSPPATDSEIRRLDAALVANAGRRIFAGVDEQGRVHAAVYIAWADGTAYYLMGGSEPDLRASGAQLLAMWQAICFAGSVAQRFDFEGSMLPQVERAFRGFGAGQRPYFAIGKCPRAPETLREFLQHSVQFRWNRILRQKR